jgi:hypothetical protein
VVENAPSLTLADDSEGLGHVSLCVERPGKLGFLERVRHGLHDVWIIVVKHPARTQSLRQVPRR